MNINYIKIGGVLLLIAVLSFCFYQIKTQKKDIENKDIIILNLEKERDSLTGIIKTNSEVFEKYKLDKDIQLAKIQLIIKSQNDNEVIYKEQVKDIIELDYKNTDKKELKEKINKQYNSIVESLNENFK